MGKNGKLRFMAPFSPEVRGHLIRRSKNRCHNCRKEVQGPRAIAAHKNHSKNENYDDPQNGRILCPLCETKYHMQFIGNSDEIGLDEERNLIAVRQNLDKLSKRERHQIRREQPGLIYELMKIVLHRT